MERKITLILGKTGQGKTVMRTRLTKPFKRLFVFDPVMQDETLEYYDTNSDLLRDDQDGKFASDQHFRVGVYDTGLLENLATISYISGDCLLVCEECSIAFDSTVRLSPAFREIIFLGRHQRVSLIATAQRAVSVPIALRSQSHRCISFAQHEDRDIAWLRTYFGDRISEIPTLSKLECLDSEDGNISRYKIKFS